MSASWGGDCDWSGGKDEEAIDLDPDFGWEGADGVGHIY